MLKPAAEKRKLELENLKNERISHIIECSFGLFSEKGIENISMNEIASQAEIGVASLYRYFQTKEDLAVQVAVYAWQIEEKIFHNVFSSEEFKNLSGYGQIAELLELFQEAVISQESFFRFTYYFDSFVAKAKIDDEKFKPYEEIVDSVNLIVINAFKKGISDGTIKYQKGNPVLDETLEIEMCFTVMHTLFTMVQKLSVSGELLGLDRAVDARRQIEILSSILLESLRA